MTIEEVEQKRRRFLVAKDAVLLWLQVFGRAVLIETDVLESAPAGRASERILILTMLTRVTNNMIVLLKDDKVPNPWDKIN